MYKIFFSPKNTKTNYHVITTLKAYVISILVFFVSSSDYMSICQGTQSLSIEISKFSLALSLVSGQVDTSTAPRRSSRCPKSKTYLYVCPCWVRYGWIRLLYRVYVSLTGQQVSSFKNLSLRYNQVRQRYLFIDIL